QTTAEIYDPVSNAWKATFPQTSQSFENPRAVVLASGKVLISGSLGGEAVYDPAADSWHGTSGRSITNGTPTLTLLPNGKVLRAGGRDNSNQPINTAEIFDPATSSWSTIAPMNRQRDAATAVLLSNGKVLVFWTSSTLDSDLFDPVTGKWT